VLQRKPIDLRMYRNRPAWLLFGRSQNRRIAKERVLSR
jgi:hypothetical protein